MSNFFDLREMSDTDDTILLFYYTYLLNLTSFFCYKHGKDKALNLLQHYISKFMRGSTGKKPKLSLSLAIEFTGAYIINNFKMLILIFCIIY